MEITAEDKGGWFDVQGINKYLTYAFIDTLFLFIKKHALFSHVEFYNLINCSILLRISVFSNCQIFEVILRKLQIKKKHPKFS